MRRISTRKITVSLRLFLSENVMFYFWFVDDWRIYRCESWWKVIDENVECSRAWTKVCLLLGVFVFQDAIQIKSADTLLVCDVGGYGISLFKNKLSIKPLTVSFSFYPVMSQISWLREAAKHLWTSTVKSS